MSPKKETPGALSRPALHTRRSALCPWICWVWTLGVDGVTEGPLWLACPSARCFRVRPGAHARARARFRSFSRPSDVPWRGHICLSVHRSVDIWAVVNGAAADTLVQAFVWTPLSVPGGGVAGSSGSHGGPVMNLTSSCCPVLRSRQPCCGFQPRHISVARVTVTP